MSEGLNYYLINIEDRNVLQLKDGIVVGRRKLGGDVSISRKHCVFKIKSDLLFVADLNKNNISSLNDKKLKSGEYHQLKDNDVISVGGNKYLIKRLRTEELEEFLKDYFGEENLKTETICRDGYFDFSELIIEKQNNDDGIIEDFEQDNEEQKSKQIIIDRGNAIFEFNEIDSNDLELERKKKN